MTNRCVPVVLGLAMSVLATSARAQDADAQSRSGPEVTPYVFLGSNTSSGAGAAIRWPLKAGFGVEVETNYRSAEINGLDANLNLVYDLPAVGCAVPYVTAGIGLEQYGAVNVTRSGMPFLQTKTAFTVNTGTGVRVRVDDGWGYRADARYFNAVGDGPERWRLYNGVTFVTGKR